MDYHHLTPLKGGGAISVKKTGEGSEEVDSLLADDHTRLLDDAETAGRRDNTSVFLNGKSVKAFNRAEGSFSMEESPEEEEAPPAYTTTTPTPTATDPSNNGGSNNGPASNKNGKKRTRGVVWWLVKVFKMVRTIGGLIFLLLAYTFLGAWMMMKIEGPKEDAQKKEVFNARELLADELKNNTVALQAGRMSEADWENLTETLLHDFESTVHNSGVTSTSKKKWTFLGSVLFCVTTYTTIGYGNIAPATDGGRIATMLYATIGVPLALIVLADLGQKLTLGLKFIWSFIRRYYYTGYCRRVRHKAVTTSYDMTESQAQTGVALTDGGSMQREGSYRLRSPAKSSGSGVGGDGGVYYSEESEGGGDAKKVVGVDLKGARDSPGRSQGVNGSAGVAGKDRDAVDVLRRSQSAERSSLRSQQGVVDRHNSRHSVRYSETPPRTDKNPQTGSGVFVDVAELKEDFKLPVSVAVGFIFAYIFLGAGMYRLWEDWTYLESFYFVFITVSTIGFGDVLPEHPNFFLLSCVYTFLGLSLVSMTINVIMEFLSKTIDRAKEKVDQAADKAREKAKAAKGKLTEVSTLAKRQINKRMSKDGSNSPPKTSKSADDVKGSLQEKDEDHEEGEEAKEELPKPTDNGKHQLDVHTRTAPPSYLPSPVSEADDTTSFRTADDLTPGFENVTDGERK
ncbi:potassium channel subfamily K member 18-like isoform X2 [Littorina saxatilis]|uniref:potassium channel subfamily K member 18-like isoform X2 n=1 Tax=Littorina saxatilis TaxID=31220 RepID=UPI0038B692A9